jgi:hypothetical protein
MATRDQIRRELQNLAKLADVIPKARLDGGSAHSGPTGDSLMLPPDIDPDETTVMASPIHAESVEPSPRAAPFSSHGVSDSIAPAAATAASVVAGGGRGALALVGGTLIVALLGGLLLGQALASHPVAASGAGEPVAGPSVTVTQARTAAAAPAPAPPTPVAPAVADPAPAPAPPASTLVVTDSDAPAVTVRSPRPAHHGEGRTSPKAAANASSAGSPTKASSHPPSAAHDAFLDTVRKSTSN